MRRFRLSAVIAECSRDREDVPMTRRVVSNAPHGRYVGSRHRRTSKNAAPRRGNMEGGFSLIEVVLALVVLAAMLASTTSLVVNAMHVSQASRLRQIATDIAADELDCAIASLNVVDASSFPTPCGEQATLLSEQGFSGQLDVPAIPTVTKASTTFSIEQEVQPGNGACVAPSGGAPPELEVTDWVTWAGGVTSAAPDWWTDAALAPKYVQESTLVAVPASALNPSDGSILVKLTDDALNGQGGVTVNLYSGARRQRVRRSQTHSRPVSPAVRFLPTSPPGSTPQPRRRRVGSTRTTT